MSRPRLSKLARVLPLVLLLQAAAILAATATPASAAACMQGSVYADCSPGWMLDATSFPTTIAPGEEGEILVNVVNIGANESNGPVTVTDELPRGVTAISAGDSDGPRGAPYLHRFPDVHWACTIAPGREENSVGSFVNNEEGESPMFHVAGGGGEPSQGE